jgi:alpha-beta hydrolase superfamily lysophospholipase
VLILFLMVSEERLIFLGARFPQGNWQPSVSVEDVFFTAADGTKLHGWYAEHPDPRGDLLYCHGNAGNVTHRVHIIDELRTRYKLSVFVFDYRGYGRSEGAPTEEGILADARAAQRWLTERAGATPRDLILLGRSLGGAVAVDLAASGGAKALILQNTFNRLADAAASHYWYVPVRFLIRTNLDSAAKIPFYHGPLLQCHGTADEVVPCELGKELHRRANEPKTFVAISGGRHESRLPETYYDQLSGFLAAVLANTSVNAGDLNLLALNWRKTLVPAAATSPVGNQRMPRAPLAHVARAAKGLPVLDVAYDGEWRMQAMDELLSAGLSRWFPETNLAE